MLCTVPRSCLFDLRDPYEFVEIKHSTWFYVQTQAIRVMEQRLKQTESPSAMRSVEIFKIQTFPSVADRIEAETLTVIRDLDENIYQLSRGRLSQKRKSESSALRLHPASPQPELRRFDPPPSVP